MARSYCPDGTREWPEAPGMPCPLDGTTLLSIARAIDVVSGKLVVNENVAIVAGKKLVRGGDDPYPDAVQFLSAQGFRTGDFVKIAGSKRSYRGETVFAVDRVQSASKSRTRRTGTPALGTKRR